MLVCFYWIKNQTILLKILILRNSLCCFVSLFSICLTDDTISLAITYLGTSSISSFDLSGSIGSPSCLNYFVSKDTYFANFCWKDLESSWLWNSECLFSLNKVKSSNCETALATSKKKFCHLQNLSSSLVNPKTTSFTRKTGHLPKHFFKWNIH